MEKKATRTVGVRGKTAKTISVYFDEGLHRRIKKRAQSLDHSVSQHLRLLARRDVEESEPQAA